jgi:hypothetical protein
MANVDEIYTSIKLNFNLLVSAECYEIYNNLDIYGITFDKGPKTYKTIKSITINSNTNINKGILTLFEGLETITFGDNFNNDEKPLLSNNIFPNRVKTIMFGDGFYNGGELLVSNIFPENTRVILGRGYMNLKDVKNKIHFVKV